MPEKMPVSLLTKSSGILGIHPTPSGFLMASSQTAQVQQNRNCNLTCGMIGFVSWQPSLCVTSSSDWPRKAWSNLGQNRHKGQTDGQMGSFYPTSGLHWFTPSPITSAPRFAFQSLLVKSRAPPSQAPTQHPQNGQSLESKPQARAARCHARSYKSYVIYLIDVELKWFLQNKESRLQRQSNFNGCRHLQAGFQAAITTIPQAEAQGVQVACLKTFLHASCTNANTCVLGLVSAFTLRLYTLYILYII